MADKTLRILVACDDAPCRDRIAAILRLDEEIEVIGKKPQGTTGAQYVRQEQPDGVVVAVPLHEDPLTHATMYQDAFDGGVLCYAFDQDQCHAYTEASFWCVLDGEMSSLEMLGAIRAAIADQHAAPRSGKAR